MLLLLLLLLLWLGVHGGGRGWPEENRVALAHLVRSWRWREEREGGGGGVLFGR